MKLSHISAFAIAAVIGIGSLNAPAHAAGISLEGASQSLRKAQAERHAAGISLEGASQQLRKAQAERWALEGQRRIVAHQYAQYQRCYDYATYTARTERGGVTLAEARRANAYCGR